MGQPGDVLSPDPSSAEGVIIMSTYEEMQIMLTMALLIVAILNLKSQQPRYRTAGLLTLAAFAKCSCKHGTLLIARGNKKSPSCSLARSNGYFQIVLCFAGSGEYRSLSGCPVKHIIGQFLIFYNRYFFNMRELLEK